MPDEAEDDVEDDEAEAERRGEGQHHRGDQQQRGDDGAQQRDQDQQHDEERDRRDQQRVARRGLADVVLDRRRAADQHVLPARLLERRAQVRDEVVGLGRVRVGLEHGAEQHAALALGGGAHLGDAVEVLGGGRDRLHVGRVGDDDLGRRAGAGREGLRQQLLALDRLDLLAIGVALREAGVDGQEAERHHDQHRRGADPHAARVAGDAVADLAPGAVRLVGAGVAEVRHPVAPAEHRRAPERAAGR